MEKIWQKVKGTIKESIPSHVYKMWIEPVHFFKATGENIVLICPNNFLKKRILENFGALIKNELNRVAGDGYNFLLEVSRGNGGGAKSVIRKTEDPGIQLTLPQVDARPKNGRLLRRNFTFDQFVVGNNSDFAYMAALSLASQKKPSQNSLLLFSPPGMGKSHLSQAAGHQILSAFPNERVFYITAEDFTNEMVMAFKGNSIDDFKKKYRSCCDVLLLEDIHVLSGRTRTQEELALTLDYLNETGKKIIYSSSIPLSKIPKMSEHLKSRIALSLISEIEPPDFRTRVKILRHKARDKALRVPSEVIEFMASELKQNVRILESGLIGVTTKSCLLGIPVDLALAESIVKNIISTQKNITIDVIKKVVSREFGITVKDMISKSRKQSVTRPRQIAIFLSRRHTSQTIQSIGKNFNRYHATVIHSINAVEKQLKEKGEMKKQVDIIEQKLSSGKF
ncbi:MAG: chromosomal replication initiator protein DnaA [Desulfobacteraceae bacterium]|nr:chromosomal replication initiator protein DnaA [Desulfobacteraceae bacterium]MBC2754722.1 chromosomal replication initiator protein DnaA [Desulfobacteraceae bacterium]